MAHDPDSELLPPISREAAEFRPGDQAETPQAAQAMERSEWDPRSAPGTYTLLAINIAVYLWMVHSGVSWTFPTTPELQRFGANSTLLFLEGQWWRLLTATFVHIGILHIASNMWCLWNLGLLGEPLLGPYGLVAVYVLTGTAGNLLSNAVNIVETLHLRNYDPILSLGAGASGAVFGIAGILIVLLSNRRLPIPWVELKRLRTSVIRFSVINLLIGGATIFRGPIHIDNSAHIGGFLCGLALGPGLLARMTAGRFRYLARQKLVFGLGALALALTGYYLSTLSSLFFRPELNPVRERFFHIPW